MIKKIHILLLTVILSFLLMPSITYACGTTSEMSCCKKGNSTKAEKKGCCKKENASKTENKECCKKDNDSKNKKSDGCDGKCNDTSCNCPTLNFNIALPVVTELKHKSFTCSTDKQKFYDIETAISAGFYSVWLLPKIS